MKLLNQEHRGFALALALCFSIAVASGAIVWAEEQDGGVPGDWLSLYGSARSTGVGGAFVAVADEPLGALWNPAGFSQMFQNAVHIETVRLFEGTSVDCLSFAMPGRQIPSFGLTILSLRSGDFERTNDLNESLGAFSEGDMAFVFSAAKSLGTRVTVGANAKIIRQTVDVFSASGVGMDVGVLYNVTPAVRLGASLMNLGGPTLTLRNVEESYPMEFRGGVSAQVLGGRGLITAEIDHRTGPGVSIHAGTEFWVHPMLALRFGMFDVEPTGGVSFRVSPNMRLDYGMSNHELGVTHRIGLSYEFGGFFASSEATPPVFSPIGEQSVTKFNLKARAKAEISTWRLEILDKSSEVVRRFSGKGVPPAHVMWDGKSEVGLPLADGTYRYWLVVTDEEGREITGHVRTVEITTAGPQGAVPVVVE
jgi:hypothetical protein